MKAKSVSSLRWKGRSTFLLAACLMLASCMTTQTRDTMEAEYIDPVDPCHRVRLQLIASHQKTQDHFNSVIAKGTAIGALGGVITVILKGGDRDDLFKGAIIGGLSGAALGYAKAKLDEAKTRDELRRIINADVKDDTRQVTEMGAMLSDLNECRRSQVTTVKRNFDDGSVTAEQTKAALQAVRVSVQEDNSLIEDILGEVTERKGVYVASISQVENKAEEAILADAAGSTSETMVDPEAVADVRELDRTSREVHEEYQVASADLFQQIEELEELTLV